MIIELLSYKSGDALMGTVVGEEAICEGAPEFVQIKISLPR
jgi:hypothetical protein